MPSPLLLSVPPEARHDIERAKTLHAPLAEALLSWFAKEKRSLPWREHYEPYAVWVSEIMLQQTQMERGVAYFERWMQRFPTLQSVAAAPEDAILQAWEGLGYYSRARNLHKTAKEIIARYNGQFPQDPAILRTLPGIGEYTAGAIASIAFNAPVPAVDANVERIFARIFDVAMPTKSPVAAGFIRQMAEVITPEGRSREMNQALMEFGALVCKKRPLCTTCPVTAYCQALRLGIVAERPVLGKKITTTSLGVVTGILVHRGKIFIQKRLLTGIWAGLWEFPGGRLEPEETPSAAIIREYAEETGFTVQPQKYLGCINHAYTRYRIALKCSICTLENQGAEPASPMPVPSLTAASEYAWVSLPELGNYAFPAAHRKIITQWQQELHDALYL